MSKTTGAGSGHIPVLLAPVLEGLSVKPNGNYIDGTFGRGGHSREIIKLLGPTGRLLAVDRDPQAVAEVDDTLSGDSRFEIVRGEIAQLENIGREQGLLGKVDGLLFDLGVSSPQLDDAARGFSFRRDGPLDMRMDPDHGTAASVWLATVDERELKKILFEYGEEKHAPRIAHAVVAARQSQAIERTSQLADIVAAIVPARGQRIHPATKTFQAIRIHLNQELQQVAAALQASLNLLRGGGRLCAISFHSLEDRCVKRFIRRESVVADPYRGLPEIPPEFMPMLSPIGKVVTASDDEIAANPRARSARLRIAGRN